MAVAMVMVVVAMLLVAAMAAGSLLTLRLSGMSRADRNRWKPATRGRVAARRRRHEATLVAGLTRRTMSRTDYHRAMSELAAADENRCPVKVPRPKTP
jgi:hypothetical protein